MTEKKTQGFDKFGVYVNNEHPYLFQDLPRMYGYVNIRPVNVDADTGSLNFTVYLGEGDRLHRAYFTFDRRAGVLMCILQAEVTINIPCREDQVASTAMYLIKRFSTAQGLNIKGLLSVATPSIVNKETSVLFNRHFNELNPAAGEVIDRLTYNTDYSVTKTLKISIENDHRIYEFELPLDDNPENPIYSGTYISHNAMYPGLGLTTTMIIDIAMKKIRAEIMG